MTRNEQISRLYVAEHTNLLGRIRNLINAEPTVIDDACAFAWEQLIRHTEVELERGAAAVMGWLTTTAQREALRLLTRDPNRTVEPLDAQTDTIDDTDDIDQAIVNRDRLARIDELPENEQIILRLYADGFSYKAMQEETGWTFTKVNKLLARAKKRMRGEE